MPTQEIPLHDWTGFFDQFSRRHQGWRATVEVLSNEIGAELEARDSPLVGISADLKDTERSISIILGESGQHCLTHIISDPQYVRLKQTNDGIDEALAIESRDGVTTLLHFRSSNKPEMLDGVIP
ncbi:MAG: DUF5335 family protein [Acidobacteria bacterium]|nr:DUF5335 family protein [Acidobacteriota bacterium]